MQFQWFAFGNNLPGSRLQFIRWPLRVACRYEPSIAVEDPRLFHDWTDVNKSLGQRNRVERRQVRFDSLRSDAHLQYPVTAGSGHIAVFPKSPASCFPAHALEKRFVTLPYPCKQGLSVVDLPEVQTAISFIGSVFNDVVPRDKVKVQSVVELFLQGRKIHFRGDSIDLKKLLAHLFKRPFHFLGQGVFDYVIGFVGNFNKASHILLDLLARCIVQRQYVPVIEKGEANEDRNKDCKNSRDKPGFEGHLSGNTRFRIMAINPAWTIPGSSIARTDCGKC